jgi:hypothetical protein
MLRATQADVLVFHKARTAPFGTRRRLSVTRRLLPRFEGLSLFFKAICRPQRSDRITTSRRSAALVRYVYGVMMLPPGPTVYVSRKEIGDTQLRGTM